MISLPASVVHSMFDVYQAGVPETIKGSQIEGYVLADIDDLERLDEAMEYYGRHHSKIRKMLFGPNPESWDD